MENYLTVLKFGKFSLMSVNIMWYHSLFLKLVFANLNYLIQNCPQCWRWEMGASMFIIFLPFNSFKFFHKEFLKPIDTHTHPSQEPCSKRMIHVNFIEDTLLWIILTFPKNKHSSHHQLGGSSSGMHCHGRWRISHCGKWNRLKQLRNWYSDIWFHQAIFKK